MQKIGLKITRLQKGAYEFARLVNEKTNGRIKIVVKCNGELGDEKSVIEQLKFGGVDFSRVSISSISDDIPALKVIQMPFLYSDGQEMFDVLNGEDGMQFIDEIEESSLGVGGIIMVRCRSTKFLFCKAGYINTGFIWTEYKSTGIGAHV